MARKQTSAKVSKLAAKYLAMDDDAMFAAVMDGSDTMFGMTVTTDATAAFFADIRTLAASCLAQDEVKG